jgi:nucleotide-binding universal stress UspA family protein
MREIGVAYDGSPESEHALGIARALATGHHTKLSAFQAVSVPTYVYLGAPAPDDAASIQRRVKDARDRIAALGGVEPHSACGDPVEELTLYSA